MSNIINIKERRNKLYWEDTSNPIVCGNTNYVIEVDFDSDWAAVETKLATFEILDKKIFVEFTGNSFNVPAMPNAYYCMLSLTCTPGENQTLSTPGLMLYLQQNDLGIEVQTMDPFVGYYSNLLNSIKKVEEGDIVVKKSALSITAENAISATHATTADSATNATHASSATYASTAGIATNATSASSATYAESAGSATTASLAANATTANHATTADSATTATNATNATHADSADLATNATNATNATHATTADSATTATNATNATHADSADLATNATNATNATHATTADSSTISHSSETQVSLTGDETISGDKNFLTNLKKKSEVVPNIKEIANKNILLNQNFSINQREETSYLGSATENVYSVDRWRLTNEFASASQDATTNKWTFALTNVNSASSNVLFEQVVENFEDYIDLKVTATIKYSSLIESVNSTTELAIYDGVNSTAVDLDSTKSIQSVTHTVSSSATTLIFRVQTKVTGTNVSIIPSWCKLEIGEYFTTYEPRTPSEELWLCQRYYVKIYCEGQIGNYTSSLAIQPLFMLPNSLRARPTIIPITYPLVCGVDTNGNYVKYNTIRWSYKKLVNNQIVLLLTTGDNSTTLNFKQYNFYCLRNGWVALDAEIY